MKIADRQHYLKKNAKHFLSTENTGFHLSAISVTHANNIT